MNMRKNYIGLNLFCLILSGIFLLGIVWVGRNTVSLNQSIAMSQSNLRNLRTERIESYATTTVSSLSAFPAGGDQVLQSSNSMTQAGATKEIVFTLPTSKILAVSFVSQAPEKNWEQPWQDACEEAVLLMFDAYYKGYNLSPLFARDEILKMVAWEENRGWGYDIDAEQIKTMAAEYFKLDLKIVENPTIEQIKEFIIAEKPVYIVASGKDLPNPHFQNGGPDYHALIIKGYDEENFITNDPGTQFGEGFKYKYNDLINAIHDWNNGDVKNGRKVILVLE